MLLLLIILLVAKLGASASFFSLLPLSTSPVSLLGRLWSLTNVKKGLLACVRLVECGGVVEEEIVQS